ncbi:hypothetical protein Tco_0688759 [Tanacetum coccineum]
MSSEEAKKESTNSDSNSDDETHVTGSMAESSRTKKLKKFDFITEDGRHIHLNEKEINHQKKLEEVAKAEAAKQEGKEVVEACSNRSGKGWKTIYDQIKSRMDYLHTTKAELAGTVLNEPVLGMIMFNSYHRQDFITIEDLKDFSNTMLYTIQEIFFRHHQGLGLDDHARTFSSLLLAEIDKRNLNPLKQMKTIE